MDEYGITESDQESTSTGMGRKWAISLLSGIPEGVGRTPCLNSSHGMIGTVYLFDVSWTGRDIRGCDLLGIGREEITWRMDGCLLVYFFFFASSYL